MASGQKNQDFFGTGVAVWTTNRIEILLEQESSASASERSEFVLAAGTATWLESSSNAGVNQLDLDLGTTSTILEPTIPTHDSHVSRDFSSS